MGRSGSALALLTPNEAHYVDFLKLRKVNMSKGTLRAGEAVQALRYSVQYSSEICTALSGFVVRNVKMSQGTLRAGEAVQLQPVWHSMCGRACMVEVCSTCYVVGVWSTAGQYAVQGVCTLSRLRLQKMLSWMTRIRRMEQVGHAVNLDSCNSWTAQLCGTGMQHAVQQSLAAVQCSSELCRRYACLPACLCAYLLPQTPLQLLRCQAGCGLLLRVTGR